MSINRRRISLALASGFLLEVINKISPLLILHHAQKTLGLVDFGWAQYQLALFESIQPFIAYGFMNYAIAYAGSQKDAAAASSQLFSHIFVLKGINALLVLLGFLAWKGLPVQGENLWYSLGMLALVLVANVVEALWLLIAEHKLATMTFLSGLLRVSSLGLIFLLVKSRADGHLFVFLSLLPNIVLAFFTGFHAIFRLPLTPIAKRKLLEIFKLSTPYALVMVAATLLDRMDIFLIKRWFGLEAAGIYSGPAKLVQSLSLMIGSLGMPFYAETVKLQDRESLFRHVSLGLWLLMAIVAPIVFGTHFVERDLLHLIFTDLPESADRILGLLSVGMVGAVLQATFSLQVLFSKGKPTAVLIAIMLGMGSVLTVTWLGRSHLQLETVALAMAVGRLMIGASCFMFAMRYLPRAPWSSFWKPLLAGFLMALFLKLMNFEHVLANIGAGGAVYVACLVLINWREFKELMQHPKVQGLLGRLARLSRR